MPILVWQAMAAEVVVIGSGQPEAGDASQPSGYRRLFFAIWPDEALCMRLHEAARRCLARGHGRLVVPENLHVTLAFLGAVDDERRVCYEQAAMSLAQTAFTLTLDRLGYWSRKQILWAGCSVEPPELGALVSGLQANLSNCGFEPDVRPFHVHVTLARHVHRDPLPGSERSRREHAVSLPPLEWQVRELLLVESDTRPEGARYSVRHSWPLG
jgi:2'-5' RNA ligase